MKALRAGFQIHLAKPIDPAELVTTIYKSTNKRLKKMELSLCIRLSHKLIVLHSIYLTSNKS